MFTTIQVAGSVDRSQVWQLSELDSEYRRFINEFRPHIYELRAGSMATVDAMRLNVLGGWRGFPTLDPDLPAAALPVA